MKYYKILKEDLNHYGMKYKEGLNVNCEKTLLDGRYVNGLFFSDAEHILNFCDSGTKIADVKLPDNELMCSVNKEEYKAHRIILSNIRNLWTVETFRYLVEQGTDIHTYKEYPLQVAAEYSYLEVVKYLVEQGADIHADDDLALQLAAENGHLEIVKYLVENGANIRADDDYALRYASENGYLEVVRYLVEQGAGIHTVV